MQDDTRTGVSPGMPASSRLLAINPSWYARTYTGARAEIVQIPLWVKLHLATCCASVTTCCLFQLTPLDNPPGFLR